MPVEVLITDSQVRREFVNGVGFGSDVSDYTPNLAGSVMERVEVTTFISLSWGAAASQGLPFEVYDGASGSVIKRSAGKWSDDGLSIGDTVSIAGIYYEELTDVIIWSDPGINIQFMNDTTIYLDDFIDYTVIGSPSFDAAYPVQFIIKGLTALSSLRYKPNLVGNEEPANFISKVTGEEVGFYAKNITGTVRMPRVGTYAGWDSGECYCSISDNSGAEKAAEVRHIFIIAPWFTDGQLDDLINGVVPSIFEGSNSLKYAASFAYSTTITDSTGDKKAVIDYLQGSVGWFGQNLNGLKSDYAVAGITYTDTASGAPKDGVDLAAKTTVTITASKLTGSFSAGNKCGVYCSLLPAAEDYTNTETGMVENFMYDRAFSIEGGAASVGDSYISNLTSSISGSGITVSFDIQYTAGYTQRLLDLEDPQFLVAVQLGDYTLDAVNSDSVVLTAGVGSFVNEKIILGLAASESFRMWRHNEQIGADAGKSDSVLWNESGIAAKFDFSLDLSKESFIYSIEQKVVAYRSTDDAVIELDSFNLPTEAADVINGVQQLGIDKTKGYKLADGSQFNTVSLETGARVGDVQSYSLTTGQKTPWQSWQEATADEDAKQVFYDKNKPFNGINKNASQFSGVSGFNIAIAYRMVLSGIDDKGQSGVTDYWFVSPAIQVYDYGKPEAWTGIIETFDPDTLSNTDLQVLDNKKTLFRITWEKTGVPIDDIEDFWAVQRIEPANQGGSNIHELSTINPYPDGNALVPSSGETQLKMYIDAGKVVTECYINPSAIDVSGGVNLSGEICAGGAGLPVGVKLMEDGTPKIMEDGTYKIIE